MGVTSLSLGFKTRLTCTYPIYPRLSVVGRSVLSLLLSTEGPYNTSTLDDTDIDTDISIQIFRVSQGVHYSSLIHQ